MLSVLGFWNQDYFLGSLFVQRIILTPATLNAYHIDFFSKSANYYWSNSKLTLGLLEPAYSLGSANIIGLEYFGNDNMSANTGWIGSGFAQAGYVGVFFYSIIISALISFLEQYTKTLGRPTVVALFIIPMVTIITSSDLTDMLLTHGLVFSILLLIYFPSKA